MSALYDQSEDTAIVTAITAVVREADKVFERVGGSSRHWARDCFLPLLNQAGFALVRVVDARIVVAAPDLYKALFEIREACCSGMGTLPPEDIERGQKALEKADGKVAVAVAGTSEPTP